MPLIAPLLGLKPVAVLNQTVPYPDVAHAAGAGVTDPICQPGGSSKVFPVGLVAYNITTNRALYNLFKEMVKNPLLNASIVQFEGYPMEGVQAVADNTTAYAHRADKLLVYVA